MKMYISIHFSYRMPTEFGYAYVNSNDSVIEELRDIDNVEKVVKLMKKFFSKKNLNGKEIVLSYSDLDDMSAPIKNVSRICEEYNGYDLYIYEGRGAYTNKHADKMTVKDFREFYLNCANCALDYQTANTKTEVGA